MASPNIPSHPLTLPPEIWRLIIHSFSSSPQDLIFLWADCRYISHHFKHEIEQLFITTHLKLIPIDFHMASQYQDITPSGAKRVGCRDHDVLTVFHGLSKDRLDAIYKAETEHGARFLSRLASTDRDVSPSVHTQSPLGNFMNTEFKFDAAGDMHVKWTALLNLLTAEAKSFGQLSPAVSLCCAFRLDTRVS